MGSPAGDWQLAQPIGPHPAIR